MRWWPKILTYGNWGGPGWSGGRFTDDPAAVAWEVEPVDAMDAAFREHDFAYQHGASRPQADLSLVRTLAGTDVRGLWPNIYRIGAIIIFSIRSAIAGREKTVSNVGRPDENKPTWAESPPDKKVR